MGKATILIVDDEPTNLAILTEILRPFYRVRAATTGKQALHAAATTPHPDLILLDVMMPGIDGYAVLRDLRATPSTSAIPIIFVTALGDEADEERGLALGAADYIVKPVKASIVLARARTQLELKSAQDRLRDQNRWLEDEVEKRLREVQLIQDVSLCALAELAETRDAETGNHILRTQAFAEILAQQLQRSDEFRHELDAAGVARIAKAAPLHDIGKVGIPDRILLKPGPLSTDEFTIMKTHSRIGGNAIDKALKRAMAVNQVGPDRLARDSLTFLETAKVIAIHHHERWDGHGYPDGLSGEAIPLPARIMAVADVFDALTSPRVYKPAIPMTAAAAFMQEETGYQFDPRIMQAFGASQDHFRQIAGQFGETGPT